MDKEETKILNHPQEETENNNPQKRNVGGKMAYAVGGYATGVASGVTGSAFAATGQAETEEIVPSAETQVEETAQNTAENVQTEVQEEVVASVPNQEDVLLATNEGVRIAQVNDDASFDEAFADARRQVGAGGAFEWRGHVYGTYYEEEWNGMSMEERAQYQAKIDYRTIAGEPEERTAVANSGMEKPRMESHAELVDEQSATNESIKILGVEAVTDQQGNPMTVAAVEVEGNQSLLVDVDNNGMMDVIMIDENRDGQISENEIYDVSDARITTADLQQMISSPNPGMMTACNDGMPDYVNDADISSMA
ncbi:hypothetical protein AB9N12_18070 [Bacteroides sp. AN502(2024)]|uniref:hypothetical protein n=1 Tax=Bacteroides sp. AN502(2024) TaxID=3160599 RepID=UPI003515599E